MAELDKDGLLTCSDCNAVTRGSRKYDLTSPRQWLEFLEENDQESGAYTVLRCDYKKNAWNIWGLDFHVNRLGESYCTLQSVDKELLGNAKQSTNVIFDTLLEEAALFLKDADSNSAYIIMLTFSWQKGREPKRILVRGHASWSGKPGRLCEYNPEPIAAVLALSCKHHEQMPNRYTNNPESKLSAWCRQRRPLEEAFHATGEILLTRPVREEVHILEGLTSNVFFVYPNNKVRTAEHGVLKGYARKLVLDCANVCGLHYDPAPIRVQDAHLWLEVFLTSSVRLIDPVETVSVPDEESGEIRELWSDRNNDSPRWRLLYQEMLKYDSSFITRKNALDSLSS
jgi:hypothetical protein